MRKTLFLALILIAVPLPSAAQDMNASEVIVTANRRQSSDYERMPLIGLRRTADFAVQYVSVAGDTREMQPRRDEIFAMVRGAIEMASARGVELSTGTLVVEPLTLAGRWSTRS